MNRRSFLASILAAGVAPHVMSGGVASGIFMPVRQIWKPSRFPGIQLLDASGLVLAEGSYPPDIEFGRVLLSIPIMRSGTIAETIMNHPILGRQVINARYNSDYAYYGTTMNIMHFQIKT